jgi:molecular chaperone DnaK (HSP70)
MTTTSIPVGLDLGTTISTLCWYFQTAVEVIKSSTGGSEFIPSHVGLKKDRSGKTVWIFGEEARQYGLVFPERLIYDIKRMMGRQFDDPRIQDVLSS